MKKIIISILTAFVASLAFASCFAAQSDSARHNWSKSWKAQHTALPSTQNDILMGYGGQDVASHPDFIQPTAVA